MERHCLTVEQWECIAEVFPPPAKTGHPPPNRRRMMDGILHILRAGAPWRDLPKTFGPWQTVWYWFNRWNSDGTLGQVLAHLQADCVDAGESIANCGASMAQPCGLPAAPRAAGKKRRARAG